MTEALYCVTYSEQELDGSHISSEDCHNSDGNGDELQ
jgi:hypothetical protein